MPANAVASGRLLFVGQVFCDLIFSGVDEPRAGAEVFADGFALTLGGIANKAVAAARAGAPSALLSRLGDDALGTLLRARLDGETNLDITAVQTVAGWTTPVTVALAGEHDRSFITYQEELAPPHLPAGFGPVAATHVTLDRELPEWLPALRAAGTTIVGGVGWDPTAAWSSRVLDRLAEVDLFIPNDLEAMRYTRTDTALDAAKALAERVPLAIVTCGGAGVIAVDAAHSQVLQIDAVPVQARDTTGAGDIFAAAFMAARLRPGWDLSACLRFASVSAALSVERLGGAESAPHLAELIEFTSRTELEGDWSFLADLPSP